MKKILILFFFLIVFFVSGCAKIAVNTVDVLSSQTKSSVGGPMSLLLANDPFAPYFTSVPTILTTISTTNSVQGSTPITTKRFTFSSKGGVNTVFAIMAYPQAAGTYPAIVFNHGGGANAENQLGSVQTYAGRGYVTIAIDIPGIAGTGITPNSAGPWKSATAGESPRFNVGSGVQGSTLFDAGVAALQAFNYLAAQPNVNSAKMGISGVSWGGYMTTMLSGMLGTRVKAAYSIYGCGYYDLGSFWTGTLAGMSAADRTTWLTYLDAGRRAPDITAPYFVEAASNDTYFWPPAVAGTLEVIPGTKNRVIMPNHDHTEFAAGASMKLLYLDYLLKGAGSAFSSISVASSLPQTDGSLQVNMSVNLPVSVTASTVQLYYSVPAATWQTRNWVAISASLISGTTYRATLPASVVNQNVDYYGHLVDSRGVTTSSLMYASLSYLERCEATSGWSSSGVLTVNTTDKKEGAGSLQYVGAGTDEFKKVFTPYNTSATVTSGTLSFWYYVSDVTKFGAANQIELGSGGAADVNEYSWNIGTLVNGWNHITKTFNSAATTGGAPDLSAINWFRIYHAKTATITTRIDGIQILP